MRKFLVAGILAALLAFGSAFAVGATEVNYPWGCPSNIVTGTMNVSGSAVPLSGVYFVFRDGGGSYVGAVSHGGGSYTAYTSYPWAAIQEAYLDYNGTPGSRSEWLSCGY